MEQENSNLPQGTYYHCVEVICPYCKNRFQYSDKIPKPPTCGRLECLEKHYLKGVN
jgi:hypothetical protein